MHLNLTTTRRAGAALLAVLLSVLLAVPANAGETKDINTRDAFVNGGEPSYGKGRFTVKFISKHTFDIRGWVADKCPGDGKGIYVHVNRVDITRDKDSGQLHYKHHPVRSIGSDTDGCDNGKVKIDPAPIKLKKKVRMISIQLCEHDVSDRKRKHDECWGEQYDNWRLWPN